MILLVMIIASLFTCRTIESVQVDPFADFASGTNGIFTKANKGNAIDVHTAPDNTIIGVYNYAGDNFAYLSKINSKGTEIDSHTTTSKHTLNINYGCSSIYWEKNRFIIPLYTNGENNNYGILQCFDYNFNLVPSFGTAGTMSFSPDDGITPIFFTTVTKHESYYYVAGAAYINSAYHPLLMRLNLNGQKDLRFNSQGTPGYIIYDNALGTAQQLLFLGDRIIMLASTNSAYIIISLPISSPYTISEDNYINIGGISSASNMEPYDANSFFIGREEAIVKYSNRLVIDMTLNEKNTAGNIDLETYYVADSAHPLLHLKKLGSYLIAAGQYYSGNTFQDRNENTVYINYPYIACYDLSDMTDIKNEPTFLDNGFKIPNTGHYGQSDFGFQNFTFTSGTIPALFCCGDNYITHFTLSTDFTKKAFSSLLATTIREHSQNTEIDSSTGQPPKQAKFPFFSLL